MQKLLDARTHQQEADYAQAVPAGKGLKEKVMALARLRDREGYMTEVETAPDGRFRLIENHCPICIAARTCQGFCQSEWQVFSTVLGSGAKVTREEHMLAGARRCVYSIVPAEAGADKERKDKERNDAGQSGTSAGARGPVRKNHGGGR
jgi:predicted ArsR family transcriptional regulator